MGSTSKIAPRVLGIATAAALALSASACSSAKSGGTPAKDAAKDGGKVTGSFTYWSMWRADEPQAKVIKDAVDKFQTDTGVQVKLQFIGRDVRTKIGPAIAAGQAPDLWDQGADVIFGQTASAGQALDLSDVLKMDVPGEGRKVGDVIPAKYFDALTKDPSGGNHYVIPYEIISAGLFYNAADPDIAAAMPSAPATWADFIKVCDALKAKNKACLASEGEDAWTNGLLFDYQANANGVDFSALMADKSGATWDAPGVLTAAQETEQLVKGGHIIPGYDATKYPAQETNWAAGKAAFYMNGSWVTSEVAKQIPATWKFGAILPPGTTSPDSMTFGWSIPKKAKNVAQAETFMAYFLQKKVLTGIATTAGNITPRDDIAAPPELADVKKALETSKVRLTFDGFAGDEFDKVFSPNFLDLWHGKISAADFVKKMKAAQIAYWKTQG